MMLAPTVVSSIAGMRTRPWAHQIAGYQFVESVLTATNSSRLAGAGALFAEPGTGKTWVVAALIANYPMRNVLVVAPRAACSVWPLQLQEHCDRALYVACLDDGSVARKDERARAALWQAQMRGIPVLIIVNYESLWRRPFADFARSTSWDLVIFDECHVIKTPGAKCSRFASTLINNSRARIGLSGTPLAHSPLDAYAVYRALDGGRTFGRNYLRFRSQYAVMGGYQNHEVVGYQNLADLRERMYRIAFRVTKDVLDLPPLHHVARPVTLGAPAMMLYRTLERVFYAEIADGSVTVSNVLTKILRLQQCTSGHVTDDAGHIVSLDTAKIDALIELFQEIPPYEPVVVFARFRPDLEQITCAARQTMRPCRELSGARNELALWQNERGGSVLAVQIHTGGLAIDLTRAHLVIYYSLTWSLADYEQSLSRAHRGGQTQPVTIFHLVAQNTIEQRVYRALRERKDIIASILDH